MQELQETRVLFPGEGNGNPLQYSCLGNPMDRGVWWTQVHGVTKELDTTEQINDKNNNMDSYFPVQFKFAMISY